jgi:hypothetical protein
MQEWTVTYLDMDGRRVSVVVPANTLNDAIEKIRYSLSTQASQFTGAAYDKQKDVNVPRYIEPAAGLGGEFFDEPFKATEEEQFQEAFQRGLRTQFPTGQFDRMQGTTAGRTLQREFNPYQAAFFGQELALGARDPKPFAGTEEPGAFERFVTSQPVGSLRGRVGQSWRDIQRSAAKSPNDPGVAQFINPEGISQANILRGVARQQFVDRYGDYLGNIFAPKPLRSAELLGRFRGQRGTTGGHESYLAWLAQRFGTGNPAGTG